MRRTARALTTVVLTLVTAFGLAAPAGAQPAPGPLQPVPTDLTQYVGEWNQLAAIPAFFDFFCLRDTRATYTANPDGTVGVRNVCSGPFDFQIPIEGRARVTDQATTGALQVTFIQLFGRFFYFGGTNYVVAAHDPAYTWALVGDPNRGSGFLLSRTPSFTSAQWQTAFDAIVAAGYDPCRFLTTPTTGGLGTKTPLCTAPVTT